jgi:hypothetical protein
VVDASVMQFVRDEKFLDFSQAIKAELTKKILSSPYMETKIKELNKYDELEKIYQQAKETSSQEST